MCIGLTAGKDLVGKNHHKDCSHCSRPCVPLSEESGDALVELPHGILEEAVKHGGL